MEIKVFNNQKLEKSEKSRSQIGHLNKKKTVENATLRSNGGWDISQKLD